ncbi:hypothetical protein XhyaCFBP1156_04455 [Xanthomonas hyacinthi]|uniref:Type III secretion protein n=1 Tax=Xanthomonas hyacinthi TaxID=56455 RepID=A0A2S7EZP8_9XANT|nr:hypothetical protein Y886_05965 [Xanthomonas hyacinthi DSM 19077]PPU98650.1 hypothetical protein XhyaCFBP1156_04455 [Xanthomonas hyacinthi]
MGAPPLRQNVGMASAFDQQKAGTTAPLHRSQRPGGPKPAVNSEINGLRSMMDTLRNDHAALSKRKSQFDKEIFLNSPMPDHLQSEYRKVVAERNEVGSLLAAMQRRLDFISDPKANSEVQQLMRLAKVRPAERPDSGPGLAQGNAIRKNIAALEGYRDLLGNADEMRAVHKQLGEMLKSGTLDTLPAADLKQLHALAGMDIEQKFDHLQKLEQVVDQTRTSLSKTGGAGLFEGIPYNAKEHARAQEQQRQNHQDSLDMGYL